MRVIRKRADGGIHESLRVEVGPFEDGEIKQTKVAEWQHAVAG